MQGGGPALELNGVSATALNTGIHTSILKHAPCKLFLDDAFSVLRKSDQPVITTSQMIKPKKGILNG